MKLDLQDLVANYILKGHVFLLGLEEGELVCTGALTIESERVGRIERMSVKKEYRRKGYASQMLHELELVAKQKGMDTLVLEINKDWDSAVQFYLSQGFTISGVDDISCHFIKQIKYHFDPINVDSSTFAT